MLLMRIIRTSAFKVISGSFFFFLRFVSEFGCFFFLGAERALRLANLVKLQIQRPALRLLYENGADIGKLTLFSEACTVAKVSILFCRL